MTDPIPFTAHPGTRACWSIFLFTGVIAFVELQLLAPIAQIGQQFEAPALARTLTLAILGLFALTILGGLGRILWIRYGAFIELTPEALEIHNGVLARRRNRLRLEHIRAIETDQNLVDRLLDTGTLELSTSGTETMDVRIRYLNDPIDIRRRIREAIDALQLSEDRESEDSPAANEQGSEAAEAEISAT